MKTKILLLVGIISTGASYANDELLSDPNLCPSLTATSRQQINTYTVFWPNCTHIVDHLTITDVDYGENSSINDFDDVKELDNLNITSISMAKSGLFFFSSLEKVNLDINLNNVRISTGFPKLTEAESITLINYDLVHFPLVDKLNNLTISSEDDNKTYSFDNFTSLKEIDGELKISNLLIKDLSSLPKLKTVNNFILKNNPWIAEFNMPSIRAINYLSIENNTFFQDLKSLRKSEVGTLRLINLQNLYSLSGIPHQLDKLIIDNVPLNDVSALANVNIDTDKVLEVSLINASGSDDYLCDLLEPVAIENPNIRVPQCDFGK